MASVGSLRDTTLGTAGDHQMELLQTPRTTAQNPPPAAVYINLCDICSSTLEVESGSWEVMEGHRR